MNTYEITTYLSFLAIGVAGVIALFILEGLLKFICNTLNYIFTSLTSTGAISLYKGLLSLVIILTAIGVLAFFISVSWPLLLAIVIGVLAYKYYQILVISKETRDMIIKAQIDHMNK